MRVRLVEFTDSDRLVKLGQRYADEVAAVLPHIEFDESRVRQSIIDSLITAHPTIFVAEVERDIAGVMVASIQTFYFMTGFFVQTDLFYVQPEYRGTRAAALLLAELNAWADRIGARATIGGNANKLNTDRTARLYERFGYQRAGLSLIRPKGA